METIEIEKPREAYIRTSFTLVLLLSILSLSQTVFGAELGQECQYTGECREGFCLNQTCRFPQVIDKFDVTGTCQSTYDCLKGFCKEGQCIVPSREEFEVLSIGTKSGCAGLIENCTGLFCAFCNVTWIFLFITSVIAGFISRRRGRMLPFIMFTFPIIMGVLFLPFLGFILGLIEIFIISIVKKISIGERQFLKEIKKSEETGPQTSVPKQQPTSPLSKPPLPPLSPPPMPPPMV